MNENYLPADTSDYLMGNNMRQLGDAFNWQRLRTEDIYALNLIQPLLTGPYVPFSSSALRPYCMAHILTDIIINGRNNLLEFGAGLSTLMIGRLIKRNNLNARMVSVEHEATWANLVQEMINKEALADCIEIIHAPLTPCHLAVTSNLWYDMDMLNNHFGNRTFDLVVIDGPPAYEAAKKEARYPALPFIYNRLSPKCAVYLDDINRDGEKSVIRKWEVGYPLRFEITGNTLACAFRGNNFNTALF